MAAATSEAGGNRVAGVTVLAAAVLVALLLGPAAASPEADFKRAVAELKACDVVSGPQLTQARRIEPGRALQLSGVIKGVFASGDHRTIILELVDGATVHLDCVGDPDEAHARSRVRCLVKPTEISSTAPLQLVDITWDKTPLEVLQESARAALKIPPKDPAEIARSAAELRREHPMPSRGGNPTIICKRAIAYLNPTLSAQEVNMIADSIISYSTKYGVDPYLVVAVIAAESRFNPKARSYKGAMGLGQLMPATAAAHNVDAYDPVANLNVAVRIISRNLQKYNGDINKALAAYNAGVGAVKRYGGVPPYRETRDYLWRIYEYWCWLNGTAPQARPR